MIKIAYQSILLEFREKVFVAQGQATSSQSVPHSLLMMMMMMMMHVSVTCIYEEDIWREVGPRNPMMSCFPRGPSYQGDSDLGALGVVVGRGDLEVEGAIEG